MSEGFQVVRFQVLEAFQNCQDDIEKILKRLSKDTDADTKYILLQGNSVG